MRTLSPLAMLRVYAVVTVLVAMLAIGSVLVTSSRVDQRSQEEGLHAAVAVDAANIQAEMRAPVGILYITALSVLNSEYFLGLSEEARGQLTRGIAENTRRGTHAAQPIPAFSVPLTDGDAFTLQRDIATIIAKFDELTAGYDLIDFTAVRGHRDRLEASLAAYVDTKSSGDFRDTFTSLIDLGAGLNEASLQMAANLRASQAELASAMHLARLTMVGALAGLAFTMVVATFYVARTIQRAFASGEREREELRRTSASLQFRNDQLNALYNVFAEITDTLSMPYVISATLRETLRVMHASMVTLRLLKGSQLMVAGNLTSEGRELSDLPPVPLGEGPTGRVARRGRSMRIDANAQDLLGPSVDPTDPHSGVASGIIVPLIVGARVVGTLACWSKSPNAFQEEDERVLEMMASQVATAVLAADTTEMFERHALQDPLTNLPNRRHLAQEIGGELTQWADEGCAAVVAMVDIDHFKRLNDDFGHKVGDVTLQKVATVMRHSVRGTDRIYRYGGEEFVIIFPDTEEADAIAVAERLRTAIGDTPLSGNHLEPVGPVTVSVGLAVMPRHGTDFMALIDLADRALYRAKEAGRNRIVVWDENLAQPNLTRIA